MRNETKEVAINHSNKKRRKIQKGFNIEYSNWKRIETLTPFILNLIAYK